MTDNYGPAHWRPSPNFSAQARTIDMIIIHDTEGSYEQSINYLCQSSTAASAHYIFRSVDGDVSQMVHEADVAWHSGDWDYNVRSIGIEHEGHRDAPAQWYTDTMLTASAKLVADICRRYSIAVDRQHIIGHMEVRNPDGTFGGVDHHTDPGPGWPWDRYLQMVRDSLAGSVVVPDPDYAIYAPPTINLSIFRQVLQNAGSPAFDEVNDCYTTCTDNGVNPAVALAFFALESNYGTAPGAVDRMNWGNLTDSASGQLAKYDAWALGLRDWGNHFRQGIYANRGLKTISQIVPVYQPSSAGGTILGYNTYIRGLHDLIKGWADQLAAASVVPAPRGSLAFSPEPTASKTGTADSGPAPDYPAALWRPSPYFTPGERTVDTVIIHNVEGEYQSALDWLCGTHAPRAQASMHYLLRSSDGDITQMVHEADTAWHAGNWEYNQRSVGVGHEGYAAQPDKWYTDAMLQSSARLVADICHRHGIPIDRQHIIGHNEVTDPSGQASSGRYSDPGPGWPWDRYIALVKTAAAAPASAAASNPVLDRRSSAAALSLDTAATDYPAAHWVANPNFGSRLGNMVNMVLIHDTEGPYQASIDYLLQSGASAHYILRSSDGDITQMVREVNAAWHAGNLSYNRRSIGIEHEGYANAAANWYTDVMLTASAKLVADICRRYNIPIDRDHIIGHYQVPDPYHAGLFGGESHHTDPGAGWPWDKYIQMVQGYSGQAPAPQPSGDGGGTLIKPDPDYPIYAAPSISNSTFREVLANAGSPAFDEVDDCYNVCVQQGVNPAVALAFFALESNYGTTPAAVERRNWGNLTDHASGQLKTYSSWKEGLTDWCNHFRIPAYANAQTISQVVPIYQPSSVPHTIAGYNDYITRLHDLIKGWSSTDSSNGGGLSFGSGSGTMNRPHSGAAPPGAAAPNRPFEASAATSPPTAFDSGGANFSPQRMADPNASDYSLLGPPSISFDEFAKVFLRHPESPLWQEAAPPGQYRAEALRPYWNKILSYHIDPLIALSFFAHESTLGRDAAIAPLHNWGNLMWNGQYLSYPTWIDGLDAWCRHLLGPLYVGAGNTSIAQIVFIYAPPLENPSYYASLLNNYIHPYLNEDPNPQFVPPALTTPDPDYAIYAKPTINLSIFRQVLLNVGSPAAPEADVCYYICTDNAVNPAVALAFFALESNYGTAPSAIERRNWGNLTDHTSGQLKTYSSWAAGLLDWCNHFRIPAYASAQTISQVVPIYQPSSAGGALDGYNRYISRLHDLIRGWADQLAAQNNIFAPQ